MCHASQLLLPTLNSEINADCLNSGPIYATYIDNSSKAQWKQNAFKDIWCEG